MKALMFDRIGMPIDVLELRETPVPEPGPGEVLVRMLLSPIIPGDALYTQGLYPEPVRPRLPGDTAGNYGVGVVAAVGPDADLPSGALVSVSHRRTWADYAVAPAAKVVRLPDGYRHELGAEFMNLVTAWDLLELSGVHRGQWLAVTGAHATVAVILSQFAAAVGVRVLAIVRARREGMDLQALGAQAVIALDEVASLPEAVRAATGGPLDGLVDCVGGPAFAELARTLGLGSRAVVYGGFSPEPFALHNLDILLNLLEVRSYAYRYFFEPPGPADEPRVRQVLAMAAYLGVQVPTAGRYALEDFRAALHEDGVRAQAGRRYFAPGQR